jgi:hypothetical protein
MKLWTVAEAIASEVDEPVLAIRGKLVKLYDQKTGEGQYGEWKLQGGSLKDDTGEIAVKFSDRDELPQAKWRGKVVEIRCTKSQKGGYSGVKRGENKNATNKTIAACLTVSGSAEVSLFEAEHAPEPEGEEPPPTNGEAEAPKTAQEVSKPAPKVTTAPPQQTAPKSSMNDGMARLYQLANTQYAAIRVVHEYLVPKLKEKGITVDAAQAGTLIQNMLIQSYYEKVHWNFPEKRFESKPNGEPPAE